MQSTTTSTLATAKEKNKVSDRNNFTAVQIIIIIIKLNAYTTYPSEHDGTLTDTFIPFECECEFISLIFRRISFSDFGAFILDEPRYVMPANSVQS